MQGQSTSNDSTIARIPLYRSGAVIAHAIVDSEHAEYLSQRLWRLHSNGYAYARVRDDSTGSCQTVWMHRVVLGLARADDVKTDHINRDRLDNRLSNLRRATHAQNMQNRPPYRGSASRYRGVSWASDRQRWRAVATLDGKTYRLGYFIDEDLAGAAVAAWRAQHMPFAVD